MFFLQSRASGGVLFKAVINRLNLAEPDYFGLQFYRETSSKPVSLPIHTLPSAVSGYTH